MTTTEFDAGAEFDRQVRVLLDHGYPALAGRTAAAFTDLLEPLRERAVTRTLAPPTRARVPFAIVISTRLVPANEQVARTSLGGKPGCSICEPSDIGRFDAIVDIPEDDAYLVFDIDREKDTLNVAPDKALRTITEHGRTPITVAEGIAFITQFPASLEKNNCFSLVASRCGDKRVPALWISQGAPKLGWCWAGNPHTWLGSASCGGRAG